MVKHGQKVALAVALVLFGAGVWGFVCAGAYSWLVAGLLAAVGGYFFLRIFSEIIEVIAETLLPR